MSSLSNMPVYLYNKNHSFTNNQENSIWNLTDTSYDQEYYEIEVFANENNIEMRKDMDEILNMTTYTCHICNIEVPKIYTKEHIKSVKHETYLQITNIALERTNLYMKSSLMEPSLRVEVKESYFCDHCAAVVLNCDKNVHVLSKRHRISVKHDDLIQKLVNIYNKSKDPEVPEDDHEQSIDIIAELTAMVPNIDLNVPCNALNGNIEENNNREDNKEIFKVVPKNKNQTKNIPEENPETSEWNELLIKDNKVIKKKKMIKKKVKKQKSVIVSKDGEKEIQTSNKTIEDTNIDFSQNIQKIDGISDKEGISNNKRKADEAKDNDVTEDKKWDEIIAFKELKSYLQIVSNKFTETHTVTAVSNDIVDVKATNGELLRVPLQNFHGFQVVGIEHSSKVACNLCPIAVLVHSDKHIWTEEHVIKIMTPIMDKHGVRKVNDILSHCILCNSLNLTSQTKLHINSFEHVNKLQKYAIENSTAEIGKLAIKNCMTDEGDAILCQLCQIQIEKNNDFVLKHVESSDHIANRDSVLKKNFVFVLDTGNYYCLLCGKGLFQRFLLSHCENKKHKKKVLNVTFTNDIIHGLNNALFLKNN